jgi:hypothetical protein
LPFRQEKQKINAEGAEVSEKYHSKEKILCGLCALCVEPFRLQIFRAMLSVAEFFSQCLNCSSLAPIQKTGKTVLHRSHETISTACWRYGLWAHSRLSLAAFCFMTGFK